MNRKTNKILSCALAALLLSQSAAVGASGASLDFGEHDYSTDLYAYQEHKSISSVSNRQLGSYNRTRVTVGGTVLSVGGVLIGGTHYIPFRAAANALGAQYSYSSATRTSTMKIGNCGSHKLCR